MSAAPRIQSSRRDQLATILDMSLSMLDSARDSDWGALDELEDRRRRLVASCFQVPTGAAEGPMVADYIGRILELNREITDLAEAGRDALGSSIRTMGAGKKAQRAYGQSAP